MGRESHPANVGTMPSSGDDGTPSVVAPWFRRQRAAPASEEVAEPGSRSVRERWCARESVGSSRELTHYPGW